MDFFWLVILFVIVLSLPDLLRRKRRYPTRNRQKTDPMGTPAPSAPLPEKTKPIELKKKRQSVFTKAQPAPEIKKQPAAKATSVPPVMPKTVTEPVATVPVGKPVPNLETAAAHAWERLDPMARQIYAGIVWSELLQPPVSLRRR